MPVTLPCPDLDRLVGDAIAGRPGADARLDAHAASCAACAAEAACADDSLTETLAEPFAGLRAATCPPDVIAAALAEVRRGAPDRAAAAPPRPRTRVWIGASVLAVALLAALLVRPKMASETASEPPLVAQVGVPKPSEPSAPQPVAPAPADPVPSAPTTASPELRPSARPAVDAPGPSRSPQPAAPPRPEPPDALLDAPVAAATPADSAAARADLLLALGIVARAQRAADAAVSAEMQRVSEALAPARLL